MDRKIIVECRFPITSENKCYYTIENENGDTIAYIHLHVSTKRNEFDDTTSLLLTYSIRWNTMQYHIRTEQERNSANWLFSNLAKVVQSDLSSVLDVDVERINSFLPLNVKIKKVKGEPVCQNQNIKVN